MSPSKLGQVLIVFLSLTIPSIGSTQDAVIYSEDFEKGWGLWSADNGVWEVGTPKAGPGNCHQGSQCVGTALNGVLPGSADSRLISPSILLPTVTGNEELHLRVWQWFSYATNYMFGEPVCDLGKVEVSIYESGVWSKWIETGNIITLTSAAWSPLSVDLTQYTGTKIRIAFHHHTESGTGPITCEAISMGGWYIDDVKITTNAVVAPCKR
jgi:hypothetical protein